MKLYKLTDENGYAGTERKNQCKWGEGVKHTSVYVKTPTSKPRLCTQDVIHAYCNPLIAVVMNPAHATFRNPIFWEAKGFPVVFESQLKLGCLSLTTVKQIPLPVISSAQKQHFAILCALEVYEKPLFVLWAKKWLSKEDRSASAASTVASDADPAAAYAARAAALSASDAADAAIYAARAAASAAANNKKINFISLLKTAIREES